MTMICSPVKDIHDLYIDPLPAGKAMKVAMIIRVDRITLAVTEDGRLYTNSLGRLCYLVGMYPWTQSFMTALVRLGTITRAQADTHLKECKLLSERRELVDAAEYVVERAKKLGLVLTAAQMKQLRPYLPKKAA